MDETEAQRGAGSGLGEGGERRRVDDRQDRVAAGRRVVVEHDDGLAVRRYLDGAGEQALAVELAVPQTSQHGPLEAGADAD